jgi:hypothetical protein
LGFGGRVSLPLRWSIWRRGRGYLDKFLDCFFDSDFGA